MSKEDSNPNGMIKTQWSKFRKFLGQCRRVLKVTRKPDVEEFLTVAKVTAIGLAIMGTIGFAFTMIQQAFI